MVDSEREYQLCNQGGAGWLYLFFIFLCGGEVSPISFMLSVFHLSSSHSPPGMVCVMAPLSSLTPHPREIPHMPYMWGSSLGGDCASSVGSRGVSSCAASCVCMFLAALTQRPCSDRSFSQSLTSNKKNLITG